MTYQILYVFLFTLMGLAKGHSALEEDSLLSETRPSSSISHPQTPPTLEVASPRLLSPAPALLPPPIPWTFEETAEWISILSAQKVWPSFFEVLSTLPSCSHPPSPFTIVRGATLQTGQYTRMAVTHAGLVSQVINNGTLLRALKTSPNKAFGSLIKKLEAPVLRPLEYS